MHSTVVIQAAIAAAVFAACSTQADAASLRKCTDPKTGAVTYSDTLCAAPITVETKMDWKPQAATNVMDSPRIYRPSAKAEAPKEAAPLMAAYRRWVDAEKVAIATPRLTLSGPLRDMQAVLRETESLPVPACLTKAKTLMLDLMTQSVDKLISFMGSRDNVSGFVYVYQTRSDGVREIERELAAANCAPPKQVAR